MESNVTAPVVFEERATSGGGRIGIARLNAEKYLNALSLEMIDLLGPQFARWATDSGIVLGVLEAAGEQAFAAGAALHRRHKAMLELHASPRKGDIRANAYAAD